MPTKASYKSNTEPSRLYCVSDRKTCAPIRTFTSGGFVAADDDSQLVVAAYGDEHNGPARDKGSLLSCDRLIH